MKATREELLATIKQSAAVDNIKKAGIVSTVERKELDKRIKVILALCQVVMSDRSGPGSTSFKEKDLQFWLVVRALDQDARQMRFCDNVNADAVQPGRFVQWPIKDGYARYIVSGVGKKSCKVVLLPYLERYESGFVQEGEVPINEIEYVLGWEDHFTELFRIRAQAQLDRLKKSVISLV